MDSTCKFVGYRARYRSALHCYTQWLYTTCHNRVNEQGCPGISFCPVLTTIDYTSCFSSLKGIEYPTWSQKDTISTTENLNQQLDTFPYAPWPDRWVPPPLTLGIRATARPVPHDSALVWWPAIRDTAWGCLLFLAMLVCTNCTTSRRIGTLNTAGSFIKAFAWPSSSNTDTRGLADWIQQLPRNKSIDERETEAYVYYNNKSYTTPDCTHHGVRANFTATLRWTTIPSFRQQHYNLYTTPTRHTRSLLRMRRFIT